MAGKRSRWTRVAAVLAALLVCYVVLRQFKRTNVPEQTQLQASPGLAGPTFLPVGGVFTNVVSVKLSTPSNSGVIRYTVDGSEPNPESPKYTHPIGVSDTAFLKAKVFQSRKRVSETTSQTYVLLDSDLISFNSNLPLVVLNSFGQGIQKTEKTPISIRLIGTNAGRSTLLAEADFDGHGDINIRGHSSLRYPKHSYHLKTKDDAGKNRNASILGLPKESDWVLYAPYSDKTLMRDVLGYELSNEIGQYAARTRFVELFLNESGGRLTSRHYLGVFVFEERIKRDKNRVNIAKLGPNDNSEPEITGGYIFKKDHLDRPDMGGGNPGGFPMGGGGWSGSRPGFPTGPGGFPADPAGFLPPEGEGQSRSDMMFRMMGRFSSGSRSQLFVSSQGNQFIYVEPNATEISSGQRAWLSKYVNKLESTLYGGNFRDPQKGYAAYFDMDSFIDHHLLVELTKNIDGFRFSTFYYKDRGGKIHMGPIWDWNLSLGNANGKQGWIAEYWYWPQLDDQQYTWFRRLFEDPDFAQRYVDRWGQLRTNQFSVASIHKHIDELASLLSEAQARNYRRWRILGRQVWPNTYVGKTYDDEVNWMKEWIQTRINWIDNQFVAAPAFSLSSGSVKAGSKLALRGSMGKVYYTTDGSDPRAPGGEVSSRAVEYGSPVTINDHAVVFSRTLRDNRWSYPAIAKFTVAGKASKEE